MTEQLKTRAENLTEQLKTKAEVTEQLKIKAENLTEQLKTKAEVTEQLKIKAKNLTENYHLSPSFLLRFFVFQKYYQHKLKKKLDRTWIFSLRFFVLSKITTSTSYLSLAEHVICFLRHFVFFFFFLKKLPAQKPKQLKRTPT